MEKTDPAKELLAEMHRNLEMGSENLASIVPKITEPFFLAEVTNQLEGYAGYTKQTLALMESYAVRPQKSNPMKTLMARGGIAMNTLLDDSDAHIAEMIQRGTQMGADTLEKTIATLTNLAHGEEKSMPGKDASDAIALGKRIVSFERTCADRMTEFL